MNRTELRQLSIDRLDDAKALYSAGRWSGAYYLAGYSIECALKACVMRRIEETGIIFIDKKFAAACWTHNLQDLIQLAGLDDARVQAGIVDPNLEKNWQTAKTWNEVSRYERRTQAEAEAIVRAIDHPTEGILSWLKNYW